MTERTRMRSGVLLLALALVASACGSGSEESAVGAESATPTPTPALDVREDDIEQEPEDVDVASESHDTDDDPPPPEDIASDPGVGEAPPSAYVPPAGRYVYDTSGYTESGSGPTKERREAPPTSVDEITVEEGQDGTEIHIRTSYEGDSTQEIRVMVSGAEARLTRLGSTSTANGVEVEQAVSPEPPVLVARLPYTVGDRWETAWEDPSLGIQGVGWGAVLRQETVATGVGSVEAIVLEVHQRLRGSVDGELTFTLWIDPSTGMQVKQVLVSEFEDAFGGSRSEITRILRTAPT